MPRQETNSADTKISGAEKEFSIDKKGSINQALENGVIDTDVIHAMDQIELEKFMHDTLTIEFADPANESEAGFAEITVNGDRKVFARDSSVEVQLPRKHVEALAHAKVSRVRQEKVVAPDGSMGYVEKFITGLAYPFTVKNDPSKRGRAWLQQQLANPV